jgi:hypothetical protein
LDVADRGGATLESVGELLGVVRERVRQIEKKALSRVRSHALHLGLRPGDWPSHPIGSHHPDANPQALSGTGQRDIGFRATPDGRRLARADLWADRCVAYLVAGVPLRNAWSLANGCDPSEGDDTETSGGRDMSHEKANGAAASNDAALTAAAVQAYEEARRGLLARLADVEGQREAIKRALEGTTEAAAPVPPTTREPAAKAAPAKRRAPTAKARKKKPSGASPEQTSLTARCRDFIRTHPGCQTSEIAAALGVKSGKVSGATNYLKRTRAITSGADNPFRWRLSSTQASALA